MQTMQQRFESDVESYVLDLGDLTPVITRDFNNTGTIFGMDGFTSYFELSFDFQSTYCSVKITGRNFDHVPEFNVDFKNKAFGQMMDKIHDCIFQSTKFSAAYAQRVDDRRNEMRREIRESFNNKLITPCGQEWRFFYDERGGMFCWSWRYQEENVEVLATPWWEGTDGIPMEVQLEGEQVEDECSHIDFPDVRENVGAKQYVAAMREALDDLPYA